MEVEWKPIPNYEGIYEVSSCGKVRSLNRRRLHTFNKGCVMNRYYKGKVLAPVLNGGYFKVTLTRDNIPTQIAIHRLVATAFLPNADNKPFVNHKNGIKTDNNFNNLEWVTPLENCIHASDTCLLPTGDKHPRSKLTEDQVIQIKYHREGILYKDIAKEFNIDKSTVSDIKRGKTWQHINKS